MRFMRKISLEFYFLRWLTFDVIDGFNREETTGQQQLELPRVHGLGEPVHEHTLGRTLRP